MISPIIYIFLAIVAKTIENMQERGGEG